MSGRQGNKLPSNLPQLQNLIKRDPTSYTEEVRSRAGRPGAAAGGAAVSVGSGRRGGQRCLPPSAAAPVCVQFLQQYHHYQSHVEIFTFQPDKPSKELAELVMFLAQVRPAAHPRRPPDSRRGFARSAVAVPGSPVPESCCCNPDGFTLKRHVDQDFCSSIVHSGEHKFFFWDSFFKRTF